MHVIMILYEISLEILGREGGGHPDVFPFVQLFLFDRLKMISMYTDWIQHNQYNTMEYIQIDQTG